MKHLLFCRHAKSSWKDLSLADIDRPLNKRGKRDAPEMGRRLAARSVKVDAIVSSPAVRARKTARFFANALGYPRSSIIVNEELYGIDSLSILAVIHALDNTINTAVMVGHNPEFTNLVNILGNLHIANVPTCGIVALGFPFSSWKDVKGGSGHLDFFDYPKNTVR